MKKHTKAKHFLNTFILTLLLPVAGFSQLEITGTIKDELSIGIPGAVIEVHELNQSYLSDIDGSFHIKNLKAGRYHLHISSIGYEYLNIDTTLADSSLNLIITLKESVSELNEVIIETSPFKDDQKTNSLILQSVDEEFVENSGGSTLINSLETAEGIQSINTGVGISKPVIRGLTGNRLIVNEAGIKQEGQQWANDHGLEIDQYNAEQIEIIKGPSALAYGSDALAGVINIKRNSTLPVNQYSSDIKGIFRSYNNTFGGSFGGKTNLNNNIFHVRYTQTAFGDYKVPTDSYSYQNFRLPIYNNKLKNTAGQEQNLFTTIGINRNWGFSHLSFSRTHQKIGLFPGAIGVPQSYSLSPDGNDRDINLPFQDVTHTKVISNNSFNLFGKWTELDMAYQFNNRKEFSKPDAHGLPLSAKDSLSTQLKLHTVSANLKLHNKSFNTWKSIYGLQVQGQINQIDGYEFIIPAYQDYRLGLYSLFKKEVTKKLHANFGFRIESAIQKSEASQAPFYYNRTLIGTATRSPEINNTYLNYATGLGFSYLPKNGASWKLNIGKTYRIPNIAELAANGSHNAAFRFERGDPDLKPEEGYQLDLGYLFESAKWHFTLNGFSNYFRRFIFFQPQAMFATQTVNGISYPHPASGQVYQYTQADAVHFGGELNAHYHLSDHWAIEVVGEATFGHNLETNLPLPLFPPISIKPAIEHEVDFKKKTLRSISSKIIWSYYAAQNRVDRNELPTEAYNLLGAAITMKFGKMKEVFKITVSASNLLNTTYLNHLSRYRQVNIPEPGRNFSVTGTFYLNSKTKI